MIIIIIINGCEMNFRYYTIFNQKIILSLSKLKVLLYTSEVITELLEMNSTSDFLGPALSLFDNNY